MKVSVRVGFPFFSILTLIFIALKLAGVGVVAAWSWWWVLSPIWIPFAIVGSIWMMAFIFMVIVFLIAA